MMNLISSLEQDTAEELSPLDVVFYATLEVKLKLLVFVAGALNLHVDVCSG